MAPYGEPDWATPGAMASESTQNAATGGSVAAAAVPKQASDNAGIMLVLLSFLDIACGALMTTLGVMTLLQLNGINDTAAGFLAAYMIIFALLLLTYELMWWMGIPAINKTLRKNFGFLYGLKGKGLYMIFIAFLTIGLKNDSFGQHVNIITWATGISFLAVGSLHIFLVCVHPTISIKYRAPTAGLDSHVEQSATNPSPNPV